MVQTIHKPALIISVLMAGYLKFMLLPTANGAFELYHLTHIDFIYHLYSALKVIAVLFNGWAYQDVTCVFIAALTFYIWQRRKNKKLIKNKVGSAV